MKGGNMANELIPRQFIQGLFLFFVNLMNPGWAIQFWVIKFVITLFSDILCYAIIITCNHSNLDNMGWFLATYFQRQPCRMYMGIFLHLGSSYL